MIMPSKYIREEESLIGISGSLLLLIEQRANLSQLWEEAKKQTSVGHFGRFILALDLLYMLGLIELKEHQIVRVHHDS